MSDAVTLVTGQSAEVCSPCDASDIHCLLLPTETDAVLKACDAGEMLTTPSQPSSCKPAAMCGAVQCFLSTPTPMCV